MWRVRAGVFLNNNGQIKPLSFRARAFFQRPRAYYRSYLWHCHFERYETRKLADKPLTFGRLSERIPPWSALAL